METILDEYFSSHREDRIFVFTDLKGGSVNQKMMKYAAWPNITAVSYTHLDVYKRQQKGAYSMCQMYGAKEMMEVLGVSESKAYAYIRQMNQELDAKGYLTIRGKVPEAYVRERFFGFKAGDQEAGA